jgi:hypothetical protein
MIVNLLAVGAGKKILCEKDFRKYHLKFSLFTFIVLSLSVVEHKALAQNVSTVTTVTATTNTSATAATSITTATNSSTTTGKSTSTALGSSTTPKGQAREIF